MPTEIDPTIIALASLALGIVIGALLWRALSGANAQRRRLDEELRKKDQELKTYRHEVTEHFIKTSALVNNLTQSYREVHQHLADSAMNLTNAEVSRQLLEAGGNQTQSKDEQSVLVDSPQPPKDYTPDVSGVLDEKYGLEKASSPSPGQTDDSTTNDKKSKAAKKSTDEDDPTLTIS